MQRYKDEGYKVKRYGQVFSGELVSNLLVSMLPQYSSIQTIVDPMVGQGDLLRAASVMYPNAETILGIDIDKDVVEKFNKDIPQGKIIIKDAFNSKELNIEDGWDLVITNPPYVRYQTLKSNPTIGLPDGKELRESLVNHILCSRALDDQEKQLYLDISRNYSGLSDMAVPSWILCASIVKKGGYMAMVVPETWLNRDYAFPIHYLLLRCFDIVAIARDVECKWFENAEVRTCLIICRRKENQSIRENSSETVVLEIGSGIMTRDSLVGELRFEENIGNDALNRIIYSKVTYSLDSFNSRIVPVMELFPGLFQGIASQKWICKEDRIEEANSFSIPSEIKAIVGNNRVVEYDSLNTLGWSVGQGLRSGANDFFYARIKTEDTITVVQTESWYGKDISLSSENVRKALKKRSDIKGLVVNYCELERCIFYIQKQIRKSDSIILSKRLNDAYSIMNSELDDYITEGEKYISPAHKRPFRELSAVKPNEKKVGNKYERFWYMLPPLKERHLPNLCISRVCGDSPETLYINQLPGQGIVVDANFITLWNPDRSMQELTLALLNSTWAKLFLEITGTPMGGGALKIEASQVRRIVFPRIDDNRKKELEEIGRKIISRKCISKKLQKEIDDIVTSPFEYKCENSLNRQFEDLLQRKIQERTGHKYDE